MSKVGPKRVLHEQRADDQRHGRNRDRVPQAVVDIAGRRAHGEGGRRQQAAEPAVADMVGQRHAGVADAGREHLDQDRRDRAVDHRHVDDEHEQDRDDLRPVYRRRVGHHLKAPAPGTE